MAEEKKEAPKKDLSTFVKGNFSCTVANLPSKADFIEQYRGKVDSDISNLYDAAKKAQGEYFKTAEGKEVKDSLEAKKPKEKAKDK